MIPLSYRGVKNGLKHSDLPKLLSCNESSKISNNFEKKWKIETSNLEERTNSSLTLVLFKIFFWKYIGFGVLMFLQNVIVRCGQAIVLSYFIESFLDITDFNYRKKIIFGSVLVLLGYVHAFLRHHSDFGQACIGMRARIGISSLVYKKVYI